MSPAHAGATLLLPLALLAAAVFSVPIAKWLRLSPIVAYMAAGIVIGPYGVGLFGEPGSILAVADLGVVLLLFVIGLELELSRVFAMRGAIFGLGAAQLALTAAILTGLIVAAGLTGWRGGFIASLGLAMSSTAIALQILDQRGDLQKTYGQRAFAILLFQDMAVVPLLALVPFLAPGGEAHAGLTETLIAAAKIAAAIIVVVIAGRYLLNPFLRLLASTGAREVMTAASLLVVLGAAALMQAVGMSMALGAFLAGVMLAESNYRHELEADIEPFRGLLLALFFMGVGMSIDLSIVRANLLLIVAAALAITLIKIAIIWLLFLPTCPRHRDALQAGSVLTAAGEFAFVLIPLGVSIGALKPSEGSLFAAIAATLMVFGPAAAALTETLTARFAARPQRTYDDFSDVRGSVLVIGFGRFGQIVSQCLLAEGVDAVIMDKDPEMIENAGRFGFRVYYGDGTRLDLLRAAGAGDARMIAVCVDARETADRIVAIVRAEFPGTLLYIRSYDRRHTLRLIAAGVDFEIRETFESALVFGRRALEGLGLDRERAAAVVDFVRTRDLERLELQEAEGLSAGLDLLQTRLVQPEPLSVPRRSAKAMTAETEQIMDRRGGAKERRPPEGPAGAGLDT
jgi:monovalent cation:proton antiporter-2 (CPA2) family protein